MGMEESRMKLLVTGDNLQPEIEKTKKKKKPKQNWGDRSAIEERGKLGRIAWVRGGVGVDKEKKKKKRENGMIIINGWEQWEERGDKVAIIVWQWYYMEEIKAGK
jgi:hypothetical protein